MLRGDARYLFEDVGKIERVIEAGQLSYVFNRIKPVIKQSSCVIYAFVTEVFGKSDAHFFFEKMREIFGMIGKLLTDGCDGELMIVKIKNSILTKKKFFDILILTPDW